jgi:hypothetical protein
MKSKIPILTCGSKIKMLRLLSFLIPFCQVSNFGQQHVSKYKKNFISMFGLTLFYVMYVHQVQPNRVDTLDCM